MAAPEIIRDEIDGPPDPKTLAAAVLNNVAADVSQIVVGEGRDAVIIADRAEKRRCGDCTFCCTAAGINALEKAPMVRCKYLGARCTIYRDRPAACRSFRCAWHLGNWDDRFRPDKVGAYVAFFATPEHGFYAVVQADSKKLNHKRFRQLITRLGYLPEIRIIYDDRDGVILRHGQRPQRFHMIQRPPGDYETAIYRIEA
jgi:hypothetical protein